MSDAFVALVTASVSAPSAARCRKQTVSYATCILLYLDFCQQVPRYVVQHNAQSKD